MASQSLNKFRFDWSVDVAFVACLAQEFADRSASSFAVIASKFVHIHADKLAGEVRVHVARVRHRMSYCLIPMSQAEVDAFADNLKQIVLHSWRDIFA